MTQYQKIRVDTMYNRLYGQAFNCRWCSGPRHRDQVIVTTAFTPWVKKDAPLSQAEQ